MTRFQHAATITFLTLASFATAADRGPNVVLILVDDLGWRDLGVTGSDYYETPHVDRLFASGMHFRRGYASCQVCSPTRASLLTGKAPPRHGITNWIGAPYGERWKRNTPFEAAGYVHSLPAEDTTLAEAFKSLDYRTFFAGKWHLGGEGSLPTDHGFDINLGGHHRGSPPGGYFSPYKNPYLKDGPAGESLTLRLADETAGFIRDQGDAPYFAMLSFYTVHGPLQTTRERWEANRVEALAKPQPERRFRFDRRLPVRQVQDHPVYAGMVETMDEAVGRVLAAIDESGQRENTIVVFTSDNGGVAAGDGRATSSLPLRGGKGRQWEGGFRVPLAIAWPGRIGAGQTTDVRAISTDLYPTLLELVGVDQRPEQHVDGVSLGRLLKGGSIPDRPLFWHYPHYGNQGGEPSSVILKQDWKLVRYHEDGREELYHLTNDAGEQVDLAAENGERVAALGEELDAWLAETGATQPPMNGAFDAMAFSRELRKLRTKRMDQEERGAKRVLEADWEPDPTWWGSKPAE
ncbi:Arylsulfatase precursor [Planctomycetes bacterium MalM25]|nr:Arylsulfatase precursor [Planctomycetes bacterium MalM25]